MSEASDVRGKNKMFYWERGTGQTQDLEVTPTLAAFSMHIPSPEGEVTFSTQRKKGWLVEFYKITSTQTWMFRIGEQRSPPPSVIWFYTWKTRLWNLTQLFLSPLFTNSTPSDMEEEPHTLMSHIQRQKAFIQCHTSLSCQFIYNLALIFQWITYLPQSCSSLQNTQVLLSQINSQVLLFLINWMS